MNSYTKVRCSHCGSDQIRRAGKNAHAQQRYRCCVTDCSKGTFMLNYRYNACLPVKVNPLYSLVPSNDGRLEVSLGRVCLEAELDEQWSYCRQKNQPTLALVCD